MTSTRVGENAELVRNPQHGARTASAQDASRPGEQAGRVATVALLSAKLDGEGAGVPWVAVLSPMAAVTLVGLGGTLLDVRSHRRLKARSKSKVRGVALGQCMAECALGQCMAVCSGPVYG